MKRRFLSMFLAVVMVLGMLPVNAMATESTTPDAGYDITTGDTTASGGQMRVTNINISGAEVSEYEKTGDFAATVLLAANTIEEAALTFTLDGIAAPFVTGPCMIYVNNVPTGTVTQVGENSNNVTWTHSMVPAWDENGEATIAFKAQGTNGAIGAKTYTLNLRIQSEENTTPDAGYDITTGDTTAAGGQMRVKNINISGAEVSKYQKTGDFTATVLLAANTSEEAELTFTLDGIATPFMANMCKILVNGTQTGTITQDSENSSNATWTHSMVPAWENGKATIAFKAQGTSGAMGAKTYTLDLRILSEENTAPALKNEAENEINVVVAVGDSYTLNLTEAALWEDLELDDMSYTVSVNDADPVEANSTWYQFGPQTPGNYKLEFYCEDSNGNKSADTYTVNITAMNLTKFEVGGTNANNTNSADIERIDMGYAEVDQVILSEENGVYAYAILDSTTNKDDELYFRVRALHPNLTNKKFSGVKINDKDVENAVIDAVTENPKLIWTAEYTPEWNEYGEAELTFVGQPQRIQNGLPQYSYTIKLKIANEDNQKPTLKSGSSKTDTVMQYNRYTVDMTDLFADADDSWLWYSVSVNGGAYEACDETFSIAPTTIGTTTLKFKAKDITGAESGEFTLTLNVSPYELGEHSFAINHEAGSGELMDLTIKDEAGTVIEGVKYEMTSVEGSYSNQVYTIRVGLPMDAGVAADSTVVSHWVLAQSDGYPYLTTSYNDLTDNSTMGGVKTTLSDGTGSCGPLYLVPSATANARASDQYKISYYLIAAEENAAPQLKNGVTTPAQVNKNQYETYTIDLTTIFEDPDESDVLTYTVKVDDANAVATDASYSLELNDAGAHILVFTATDVGEKTCTYTVELNVTHVPRVLIETGEGAKEVISGINEFYIYGVDAIDYALNKDGYIRNISIQLEESTADNAEMDIQWEGFADGYTMTVENPVTLVNGKAKFTVESHGLFADKHHRYYNFSISNKANTLPTLAGNTETATEEKLLGEAYELDLSNIFTDADDDELTYTVSVNGGDAVAADAAYSITPNATGTYTLVFRANDNWGDSAKAYTVTLTVKNSDITFPVTVKVPTAITPSFYVSGVFDENGQDTLGDALRAAMGESADGWITYTVAVPENISRISFRGTDGTNEWGGMTIPVEQDMKAVTLRQVQAVINSKIDTEDGKVAPTAAQAVFQVRYGEDQYAVSGSTGNDNYGYLYYRFLLVAADNSLIYTYYTVPQSDLTDSYSTNEGLTKTVTTDSASVLITTLPLATKNPFTITAPTGATVVMYRQAGYFNYNEIPAMETINNPDGTKNVVFSASAGSIFRVSMSGEITKAGYVPSDSDGITVNWDDDDRGSDYRDDYDTSTTLGSRGDDSMYVNVNYRNNLQLDVNEEYQLRAYRIWEIINYDTTNLMIEPDFHYEIISGSDVIDIDPTDDVNGIAGNSWLDITAKKEGVAILEVTYDAIHIISGDKNGDDFIVSLNDFTFNASDPARTALVVVQVGSAKNDINFGFKLDRTEAWDVEFDTLYFTGDKGQIQLKPTVISGSGSVSKVEVSGNKGQSYTELTAGEDGYYTADIVSGNNIICVTKDDGSKHYQVVRGDKIEIVMTEVTGFSNQDGVIDAGEKIHIKFNGVHNVVGKMSGIYNPNNYKTNFTFNGAAVSGNGGQYTYPTGAQVEVTIPGDAAKGAVYTLTNGYTTNGGWGSSSGAHRSVKGEVAPGLDSEEVTHSGRNIFPEIALTVGTKLDGTAPTVDVESVTVTPTTASVEEGKTVTLTATVSPSNETNKEVTWTSGNEAIATVAGGVVTGVKAGTATITAAAGGKSATCTVTVTAASGGGDEQPDLDFGLQDNEIVGYVTVSFVDNGIRLESELSTIKEQYKNSLGTIVEPTQVPFKAYDTIAGVTLRLLDALDMTSVYSGNENSGFYLSKIGNFTIGETSYTSFGEFDAGGGSGWMITWTSETKGHSDWFINKGASEFYVANGDEIEWQYTCQLGTDIGDNTSAEAVAAVEALITEIGTVTLDSETAIEAAREAYNKLNTLQKSQVENYATLTAAEKALAALKASPEDKAAADAVEAKIAAIGTVTLASESAINEAKAAYAALTDTQKLLVENYAVLTAAEDALEALKAAGLDEMYDATAETLLGQTPDTGSVDGEWLVFGLARATDKDLTDAQKSDYETAVKAFITENINASGQLHDNKSTENTRVALALTALGYDPADYDGKDLLAALANTNWVTQQGNNSTAFALLAINAADYDASNEGALIQSLLDKQLDNGGWYINSGSADADTTAMVVQALAPYYSTNANVKAAVDKALTYLKGLMNAKGILDDTSDSYDPSVETVAQTIVALCELGIDPTTWKTANEVNLLHGLASFYVDGDKKGFAHEENGSYDQMSTEQAFYAMVAYKRFLDANATSLYDMSDLANLYRIEILASENGSITASKTAAAAGETITVTAQPLTGYVLSKLTLNDVELTITENSATFTMPAGIAILEATFAKTANTANAIAEAMLALDVEDASEETYDLIEELREAYSGLTAAEKLEIREAYDAFMDQIDAFEEYLEEAIEEAAEELEWFFDDLDEDDYSKKAWDKIEDLYDEALEALEEARFEEEVLELLEAYLEELEEAAAGELEVTFRLISDWKHDDGVDGHDEYVTWIETTDYNMPAGSTIYDLFMQAMDDFDLNQKGASKNYVESIQAPDILGGYWLGEFDNGPNSGWMYTINGDHPGYGLKEQDLEDGDEVIWHYVDDYTLEERKTTSKYYERWLEADDIDPETYIKRHLEDIVTIEGEGEVTPALKTSHIGRDVTFKFEPAEGWVIKNVYVDGKDKGAIESYKYKDLSMASRIEVVFALANQPYFVDVPETEWFYEDVMFVVNNGLFNGTGEYTFSTNEPMTRAMLVTVLYRLEGQPAVYGSSFSDVQSGQWYSDAVAWAARNGIVTGYDNGKFGVNDNVTREQMAAILYRYANYKGYDVTDRAYLNGYIDSGSISGYAVDAMSWANAEGLVNGRTYNTLAPTGTATRAEVAAIFHRFVENIVK